jgi:hypothetical protein
MTTSELISEIKSITDENLMLINQQLLKLTDEQKNWKINDNSWSIIEIIAHLNKFASYYHQTFIKFIQKTKFKTPSENFISSPLGRSAWKSMKLGNARNVKRKFKSLKIFNPIYEKQLILGNDIELFRNHLNELKDIFESSLKVNIRKVKIPISISKLIRFRLGDAFLLVVYHNERHLQQALNVINHPNFPK